MTAGSPRMWLSTAWPLLLTACSMSHAAADGKLAGESARAGVPAVIVGPDAASRGELSRALSLALHGAPVTLANDALTTSAVLPIAHADARDVAGRPLNGRELLRPETFELFKQGPHCTLLQLRTGMSWTLEHTHCAAIQRPR